ncbi:MAG: hypothetical protein JNL19_03600 [Burkholderiales bacterium]|nr:hypothetical protein [Burkholderiales bacterium]
MTDWLFRCIHVGLCSALLGLAAPAVSAPGDLDTTFNTTGYVLTQIDVANQDFGWAMAIQPDQKIVVAGQCMVQGDIDFCLARYLPNGSLDTSFSTDGLVTATLSSTGTMHDRARAMAIQPDGKIIVGGSCDSTTVSDFCLARFTTAGALDTTFGTNGRVFTDFQGGVDRINAIAIAPDGKIVAGGECATSTATVTDSCTARYLSNGALDISFGPFLDGKYILAGGAGNYSVNAVAVQADGRTFLGHTLFSTDGLTSVRILRRLSPSGVVEVTFFPSTVDFTPFDSVNSLVQQPDGAIVMGGLCEYAAGTFGICVLRNKSSLAADASFANNAVGYSNGTVSGAYAALQPDGKVLVVSLCRGMAVFRDQICLDRFHSDGKFDSSFGSGGQAYADFGFDLRFKRMRAVAVQNDGNIVVAGACEASTNGPVRFCVARFQGGPLGYRACSMDIDGDNAVRSTTDALILARVSLGLTGNAVVGGITFPATATRTTWSAIRAYLVSQCGMSLAQ